MTQQDFNAANTEEGDFTEISYMVDEQDRLVRESSEWTDFAARNGGTDLEPEKVTGRPLWEFVSDETTRALYRKVLAHVREGVTTRMFLRCDGPDRRRLTEMIVSRRPGGKVEFTTVLLSAKGRPPQRLFERATPRTAVSLPVCSWCNLVKVPDDTWQEVEVAVETMHLADARALPGLEPSVCPVCLAAVDYALRTSTPDLGSE